MKLVTFIGVCFCIASCTSSTSVADIEEWNMFKAQFSKKYDTDVEDHLRMKIFADNKMKISRHNERYARGEESFEMGMNQFGDMLSSEILETMNGRRPSSRRNYTGVTFIPPYNVTIPDFVNWTAEGAVTEVKSQGFCGSCWAFSTVGCLEGLTFRKTGKLASLSAQNLVDCSIKFGNDGCHGGEVQFAFLYILRNKGIDTESAYPYEAIDDTCVYDPKKSGATVKGIVDLPVGDEEQLKVAVATVGPVSISIDADHESFMFYSSGIYFEKKCASEDRLLDHSVLVVGYGTENGQDYWILKNSWDVTWGIQGYMKIVRNKNNHCGVATHAIYPLV